MDLTTTSGQIALGVLVILAYCFVQAVVAVLGHRIHTQTRKHDIIAEARRQRLAYLQAVAERAAQVTGQEVEQIDPAQFNVDIVEDQEMATAA